MAKIRFDNVGFLYPLLDSSRSFRVALDHKIGGVIRRGARARTLGVVALDGVSCEFVEGDRIAVVGRNGAGKSTFLRIIAGIYPPTQGKVMVEGRVSGLLAIGLGVELEDTGIENIYSIGLYLGLTKAQIESQLDDIAEFSELGEFLEMPMRTYSRGMQLRLAFAVATCFHPEILLLDEVFGAGDRQFAEKAEQRMRGFLARASIVVMTTHSMQLVRSHCNKAIWLDQGKLKMFGPIDEVLKAYMAKPTPVPAA
jgi:ABC-type polysaccharide/polyol phosphate transport system ATPase subunit